MTVIETGHRLGNWHEGRKLSLTRSLDLEELAHRHEAEARRWIAAETLKNRKVPEADEVVKFLMTKVGPKGYIHGWIKVAPSAVSALPSKSQQDDAVSEVRHATDIQNKFIPGIVAKTKYSIVGNPGHDALAITEPGTVKLSHKILAASAGSKAQKDKDDAVKRNWFTPHDAGHSSADYFVAHETGHAISDYMSTWDQDQWNAVAKALHIKISPKDRPYGGAPFEYADIGNIIHKNKDAFTNGVSQFAATNPDELQAELWAEYTLSSHPRPAAKAYGDYIMKHQGAAV